ncbi:hypothetical protein VM636_13490 [Streptomyces sp. SCSIO 75703]|uniref:hypothetical protein n=1 Tax=unclassified Streptomyces TaxID=2593676 RepID=UPI0004C175EA|nr:MULTISPECIES: hypothetical protein [unclassified Streptomyces]
MANRHGCDGPEEAAGAGGRLTARVDRAAELSAEELSVAAVSVAELSAAALSVAGCTMRT